jgi:heat-inducible transcriptional repressor
VKRTTSDIYLSERARHVFKVLVELYTRDGQPVGSRTLARAAELDLSPATIRNVMADLEDAGLIRAPHTSAGRVPTVEGYRLFVGDLLAGDVDHDLPRQALERIRDALDPDQDIKELMAAASNMLSGVTSLAGLVTLPRHQHLTLRQVAFLPLGQRRVLAVLVLNEREVQNRVLHTARDYSAAELERASSYLNTEFAGQEVSVIRAKLLAEMREARDGMSSLMRAAAEMGQEALKTDEDGGDFVMAGEEHLLGCDELSDLERLRQLFEAFSQKREILNLLDQCLEADGLQVYFGQDSGYEALGDCSLITARYTAHGQMGVLGVIGPTRLAYARVIPIVGATARLLGAVLNRH